MKILVVVFSLFVVFSFIFPFNTDASDAPISGQLAKALQMQVNYTLPYPGILPDSPFYGLKTLRDKIVSFFITDPQKQAEFDLLQADKRLSAAQTLLKEPKPNESLISQTVSKGENYFGAAITNIAAAKKQGVLVNDFLEKLTQAGIKHQQVLYNMQQVSKGQLKEDLGNDISRVQNFEKEVAQLKASK